MEVTIKCKNVEQVNKIIEFFENEYAERYRYANLMFNEFDDPPEIITIEREKENAIIVLE